MRAIDQSAMMKPYQYMLVAYVAVLSMAPGGCNHATPRNLALKDIPTTTGSPKTLADYQPWFGDPSHIAVGYNSQDPNVLRKQIESARNMGIYAFVVDR